MNRFEFIKRLALATVAVAAIPVIPESVMPLLPKMSPDDKLYGVSFVFNREMLIEAESVGYFYQMIENMNNVPSDYSLISIRIGFDGHNFIKDLQTIVLTFRLV